MPARIQRKRTPGSKVPPGAVYVGRGRGDYGKWGNPFRVVFRREAGGWHVEYAGVGVGTFNTKTEAQRYAVEAHRVYLRAHPELIEAARRELSGHDLMCWCAENEPCHGDNWLAAANSPVARPAEAA